MPQQSATAGELGALIGEQVVIDVKGSHVYIGTLRTIGADVIELADADVHFCDDSQTTSELYVLETKKNGIRANRASVYVMRAEVVSLSRLSDVVEY